MSYSVLLAIALTGGLSLDLDALDREPVLVAQASPVNLVAAIDRLDRLDDAACDCPDGCVCTPDANCGKDGCEVSALDKEPRVQAPERPSFIPPNASQVQRNGLYDQSDRLVGYRWRWMQCYGTHCEPRSFDDMLPNLQRYAAGPLRSP